MFNNYFDSQFLILKSYGGTCGNIGGGAAVSAAAPSSNLERREKA